MIQYIFEESPKIKAENVYLERLNQSAWVQSEIYLPTVIFTPEFRLSGRDNEQSQPVID